METNYIALSIYTLLIVLSIYTLLIVLATHSLTKRVAYKRGFRDGRDFERFSYRVSWGTAIDSMREDLDA